MPKEAAWLAKYLHELTVFPNGKHDDQVDSTAQMLDWFKQAGRGPTSNAGIWHLYKQRYEAQQAGAWPDLLITAAVGDLSWSLLGSEPRSRLMPKSEPYSPPMREVT